jgi:hypothetical protein
VTYRDTSADVTLDANEGIMSSDYEKFWQQIDTLKSDLVAEKGLVRFYTEAHRLVKEENAALKAENERLLPYVDAFRREEGRADKLDRKVDELNAENERLRNALRDLLLYAERNTCFHEETHRGGVIWEICDSCGAKWADDEGGKPEHTAPDELKKAVAILYP